MARILHLALAACLFLGTVSVCRAEDQKAARAILDQAIKAHGGEDALQRSQRFVRKASGKITLSGSIVEFKDELTVQAPDQFRLELEADSGPRKLQLTVVLNGDKAWRVLGGITSEMSKERVQEVREEPFLLWVTTLVPLLKDEFQLKPLADLAVNKRPANGILAVHKTRGEVKLYFDKNTHLLVKLERQGREAGLGVKKEYFYSNHKEFDGVQLPAQLVEMKDGKTATAIANANYRILSSISDKTFAKP